MKNFLLSLQQRRQRACHQFFLLALLTLVSPVALADAALVWYNADTTNTYKSSANYYTFWAGNETDIDVAVQKARIKCNVAETTGTQNARRCEVVKKSVGPQHWAYYTKDYALPPIVVFGKDKPELMKNLAASCQQNFGNSKCEHIATYQIDSKSSKVSDSEKMRLGVRGFYGVDKSSSKTGTSSPPPKQTPQEILDAANTGDVKAQYQLSILYAKGEGVLHDTTAAFAWLKKASESDYPPAMISFGQLIEKSDWKNARISAYLLYERAGAASEVARLNQSMTTEEKTVLRRYKQRKQETAK